MRYTLIMQIKRFKFCPIDIDCKVPAGASPAALPSVFRLRVARSLFAYSVHMAVRGDGGKSQRIPMRFESHERGYNVYSCEFTPPVPGLYFYRFEVKVYDAVLTVGADSDICASAAADAAEFQLTAYARQAPPPKWAAGGLIYHIFVDRFASDGKLRPIAPGSVRKHWGETPDLGVLNNDFYGGSLPGVQSKLGYLKSLGVTAIYLSPIFEARSNHKYDTGDYMRVDRAFGGTRALKSLAAAAKELGISVILDGVFSHTGSDSVYFNREGGYDSLGAYQSKQSPYFEWYTFDEFPDGYKSWWGVPTLPEVNENNPGFSSFITGEDGVLSHWQRAGVSGFRLDVADELPPEFLSKIRDRTRQNNAQSLLIGEVWEDASNKVSYGTRRGYFTHGQLDGVTNYPLRTAVLKYALSGSAEELRRILRVQQNNYPPGALDCNMSILGTHDTVRIITALGAEYMPGTRQERADYRLPASQRKRAAALLKMCALLQYTMPGVPCVYYGDEIGLEGFEDPLNRECYPWGDEDKDILNWYRALGRLRKGRVFGAGGYRELYFGNAAAAFARTDGRGGTAVFAYAGSGSISFDIGALLQPITVEKALLPRLQLSQNASLDRDKAVLTLDGNASCAAIKF